jgi:hypothetical protein
VPYTARTVRVPAAAPTARSIFAASDAASAVCPGDHCSVIRKAVAPSAFAGVTAAAPISFGRSSEKPTKNPAFPPDTADGTRTSVARPTTATVKKRRTRRPS